MRLFELARFYLVTTRIAVDDRLLQRNSLTFGVSSFPYCGAFFLGKSYGFGCASWFAWQVATFVGDLLNLSFGKLSFFFCDLSLYPCLSLKVNGERVTTSSKAQQILPSYNRGMVIYFNYFFLLLI